MSSTPQSPPALEGGSRNWQWWWALAAMAVGAWVLRVLPFFNRHGAFGYPVDYDEGVYFTASALLFQGLLPYRDFIFVHPPGSLLMWSPAAALSSGLDAATCFVLARWLAACVGAINVFLVGRLALRAWGPVAGVVAALVYATYPELVGVERGPFLEPVLNLACLAMANVWLDAPEDGRASRRWLWAGVLCGLAISVKVPGGIWLVAALLSRSPRSAWRSQLGLALAAGATVLLLVGPFVAASPSRFLEDVLLFQSQRPGDGAANRLDRLRDILNERRLVGLGLALLGLLVATVRSFRASGPSRPAERLFALVYVVTVAMFLVSPSYWNQYNAHLAASEAVLAGLGAAALQGWLSSRGWQWARAVPVLLVVAVPLAPARHLRESARHRAPDLPALGKYLRQSVPADASVCAFEPAWGLTGGRLPPRIPGAPLVVDSYALMLQDALDSGEHFASTQAAFLASTSQHDILSLLQRCRYVVLGWRGAWQLTAESQQWFREHFVRRFPAEGLGGPDLWERLDAGARTSP
ncbi:ArnT family glycosyltransferase [Archangium lansingense]|uniref:Glycosyltransferase 87 family protein n=1 Tax=Archangium lansingense TaxID=2995310 RepID=A0ABT4AIX8_9BACT|nr:glycosyltransferase 87 family protein [Archangium lansinium]MCY1081662.1 glycosyltransferase 87 family protein [Archangium lansinium]